MEICRFWVERVLQMGFEFGQICPMHFGIYRSNRQKAIIYVNYVVHPSMHNVYRHFVEWSYHCVPQFRVILLRSRFDWSERYGSVDFRLFFLSSSCNGWVHIWFTYNVFSSLFSFYRWLPCFGCCSLIMTTTNKNVTTSPCPLNFHGLIKSIKMTSVRERASERMKRTTERMDDIYAHNEVYKAHKIKTETSTGIYQTTFQYCLINLISRQLYANALLWFVRFSHSLLSHTSARSHTYQHTQTHSTRLFWY